MSETDETDSPPEAVEINFTPQKLLEILKHAASQERTVVEFRKDEGGNLDSVIDITDHVETLENEEQI
jgi:hypothetical protein